jgi:hypothetical protein
MTTWSRAVPLVVVMSLAGCGSSAKTTTTQSAASTTHSAAAASLAPYLVRAGEETGYSLEGAPVLASTAAAWARGPLNPPEPARSGAIAAESRRLSEEGFRDGLIVGTTGSPGSNRSGVSNVARLEAASAAQHEVAASFSQNVAEQRPSSQFTIATIPGSHGWEASGGGQNVANILFSEGSCVLEIGDAVPSGTDPEPAVIAGALKVYARTAHTGGVCTRATA